MNDAPRHVFFEVNFSPDNEDSVLGKNPPGLDKAAEAAFHAKGPSPGSPFPAENSWAGNTRGDGPTSYRVVLLCSECFLDTIAACCPPGAWDFPNSKKTRK